MVIVPRLAQGSRMQFYQTLWGPLYESVLDILGTTGTVLPFGDPLHGQPDATTFTTVGAEQVVFTPNQSIDGFDTAFDIRKDSSFQGIIPILKFNGTDEEADSPDIPYFTRALANMSIGAWVNLVDATSSTILSKYSASGDQREWRFGTTSGDDLQLILTDEDEAANATLDTLTDTALVENVWSFVSATYDGSANASGINLYLNGALAASTDTDDANFTSMRDKTSVIRLGNIAAGTFFDGSMAGGPLGPFFTQGVLTADQMLRLFEIGRRVLAL